MSENYYYAVVYDDPDKRPNITIDTADGETAKRVHESSGLNWQCTLFVENRLAEELRAELQQARAEVTERDKLIQSILKGAEIAAGQMGEEIGRLKCLVHAMADSVDWDFDVEDELNELVAGVCKSVEERAGETAPIGNLVGIKDPWVRVEDGLPEHISDGDGHGYLMTTGYSSWVEPIFRQDVWDAQYEFKFKSVTHWRRIDGP